MPKKGSAIPIATRIRLGSDIIEAGCWVWRGCKNKSGYGSMAGPGRRSALAHRLSYEAFVGPILVGLTIDHLCGNRACVNPDHLEQVTQGENTRRAKARRTHCKRGHPYDDQNTRIGAKGERTCRACINTAQLPRSRAYRAALRHTLQSRIVQ